MIILFADLERKSMNKVKKEFGPRIVCQVPKITRRV